MAEDVVASVEESRKLIIRISEVLEAILPQAHILEAAERFFIAFNPVRRAERHQQEQSADVGQQSTHNKRI
jgi:hypothetical protein